LPPWLLRFRFAREGRHLVLVLIRYIPRLVIRACCRAFCFFEIKNKLSLQWPHIDSGGYRKALYAHVPLPALRSYTPPRAPSLDPRLKRGPVLVASRGVITPDHTNLKQVHELAAASWLQRSASCLCLRWAHAYCRRVLIARRFSIQELTETTVMASSANEKQ